MRMCGHWFLEHCKLLEVSSYFSLMTYIMKFPFFLTLLDELVVNNLTWY